ncbi:MAG: B12-binding domain-containing radical SAM protein, partial [Deltaproteobacteria bacterium]|nr:B12-binding domain-containing radical SAM protein [Deltaproteobacteria bacterium]
MKKPSEFRVLLVYPNLVGMLVPPLSVAIFTSIFKKAGYGVRLFDSTPYITADTSSPEKRVKYLQARKFSYDEDLGVTPRFDLVEDFTEIVEEFKPDFMVVSCVEDTFLQAVKLVRSVSDRNIPTIFGGVFVTAAPEVALSYEGVNMVALQEGEHAVLEVAERVRNGAPVDDVPGVWVKKTDGAIVRNPNGPLVDINQVIPDFSLFDKSRFNRPMGGRIFRTIPLETYRGCPYKCTFCNSPMQLKFARSAGNGSYLRKKTIETLRTELREIAELYDPEFTYITDDSFLARSEREIVEFVEMYREFGLPFWFNTRPENVTPRRLELLKEVGCYRISFGVEHGNEAYRKKALLRHPTNEELLEKFEIIAQSGIAFSVNNIIGFPDETREMVFETIEFNRLLRGYDTLTVSIFTPYHGTPLREVAVARGYLDKDALTTHTTSSSLLKMPALSSQEIDGLVRTFTLYVELPKSLWPQIEKAERFDEEGERLVAILSEMFQQSLGQDQFSPRRETDWEMVFG